MTLEDWLLERLQQYGVDVYAGGEFPTLGDRLGHAIVTNRFGGVVAGRRDSRPETYAQLYERIYGTPLPAVPRETNSTARRKT